MEDDNAFARQPLQGEVIDDWVCVLDWLAGAVEAEHRQIHDAVQAGAGQPMRIVR